MDWRIPPRRSMTAWLLALAALLSGSGHALTIPLDFDPFGAIFHIFGERSDPPPEVTARPPLADLQGHDPNALPTPLMAQRYGYTCQEHKVTTEDGYINTLHRLLPKGPPSGKVVFLQHGLLGTSADYVMSSPKMSLGYLLSDQGHDVWLGNARGNAYSREHLNLTVKDLKYWDFSWDQMGKYDIPAAVDHVLKVTGRRQLYYVGHSMGTTMFWVAMNEHAERLGPKVRRMIALGPVAKVEHIRSPIRHLAGFAEDVETVLELLGIGELEPSNELIRTFNALLCDNSKRALHLCESLIFSLTGFDAANVNETMIPIILGHEPGGASIKTVVHYAQEVISGRFCKFDYGSSQANMKVYNTTYPPDYDLKKVRGFPVTLVYSKNDWLADEKDVQFLKEGLQSKNIEMPEKRFNHIDFIWGLKVPQIMDIVQSDISSY